MDASAVVRWLAFICCKFSFKLIAAQLTKIGSRFMDYVLVCSLCNWLHPTHVCFVCGIAATEVATDYAYFPARNATFPQILIESMGVTIKYNNTSVVTRLSELEGTNPFHWRLAKLRASESKVGITFYK